MLKISNLIVRTGEFELFTTQEITLKKGEKMLLIGNNSTGKTLFLKSLHKKYFGHNGNFEIKNEGILKRKRKESIFIDSDVNLLFDKSIYKNIIFPLAKVTDRTKELVSDLCNLAKLGEIYSVKCSELSYSQAKMVEIIRAVLVNPILILIDDLDNFFDDVNLQIFFNILKEANKSASIVATSKRLIEQFDFTYKIQQKRVVLL